MKIGILLAMALTLVSAGAVAAPAPASQTLKPEDLRMVRDFSRCIVGQNGNQVRRLLSLDYRTDSYRRSLGNLATATRPCRPFSGVLRMASMLLAGGFAEALLPRALAGQTLASKVAFDPSEPALNARDDGEYLGLCAVRSMPERVAVLLATAPASEEEKSAIDAIRPGLAPCVREGAAAILNRPGLRALLALAAYRIVTRDPTRGPSGGS
jgi:hypothetical protein